MNASSVLSASAVLLSLVVVASAQRAAGHGVLLESVPRASETVAVVTRLDLRFNSRIEPAFSEVRLTGPSNERIALPTGRSEATERGRITVVLPALAPGPYTVHWRVFTVDGHLSHGRFAFRVAERR
jgi:methionine-rich copper-binding protein CopC